jgi:glutamate---cysteine ligase / carboxylate-amine ligase
MKLLPFKSSDEVTLGMELEFQIIDPITGDLISKAKDLIRNVKESDFHEKIKPEITQGMIEINSSIHHYSSDMQRELYQIRDFLVEKGNDVNVLFSGGGTHPFRKWSLNKIFPTKRFKLLSKQYRYLSKRSTVFGQHVHIGCKNADDALYLTHTLTRYVPQLIAMSASSPFYQGIDTLYNSSRSTVFAAFPTSGVIPYLVTWESFSDYFYKLKKLGIIQSMKDFYWDIRPKPEFGTVEIRVCDTPLTVGKAVMLAAYIQSLAHYLLHERPFKITHDLYYVYNYNRFQAIRYGFAGEFINPITLKRTLISNDIEETIKNIEKSANKLGNIGYIIQLSNNVINTQNDAILLRQLFKKMNSLPKLVHEQCLIWKNDTPFYHRE